ncbi:hypothetical protein GGS23DRAFT_588849 [Durotheca rogersii]|uniref:uncharacterized protein n=1 Tax=Durotheca rogersii TaxID=419775 RepID=UPI00221FB3B9|nr:uncharacterized protein GGS23DRAFT_588849 [Durotheca rogersii]KAI5856717.1 hypothetical protein GGS23DRAFT_588849 [Durotheca rogersii]
MVEARFALITAGEQRGEVLAVLQTCIYVRMYVVCMYVCIRRRLKFRGARNRGVVRHLKQFSPRGRSHVPAHACVLIYIYIAICAYVYTYILTSTQAAHGPQKGEGEEGGVRGGILPFPVQLINRILMGASRSRSTDRRSSIGRM